jgi:thiamine pyrophosphate-dependent acetolactate synthase large subunit-like protein
MAIKKMTVKDLRQMLSKLKKAEMVNDDTLIEMSCDEEGNHFSPMVMIDGKYNIGIEEDSNTLTLYPM